MTLQQLFDSNDKQGFLVMVWNLCSLRKITHHEYCQLKTIHDNWELWKPNFKKVLYGNLGISDGKFIQEAINE